MKEIYLVRHGQSTANVGDSRLAFRNEYAPLTPKGRGQARALNELFRSEFGINPDEYDRPVAASKYLRAQQTAELAGFTAIDYLSLINESPVDIREMTGRDMIAKHTAERWVPDETRTRVRMFWDQVQTGTLDYDIYFAHGMFIAGALLDCEVQGIEFSMPFCDKRGYVPLQTAVIKATL